MRKIRKTLLIITVLILMCVCGSCKSDSKLLIGSGNSGGNYYSYCHSYSDILTSENKNLNVTVKETEGSEANLRLLQQGFLDVAIVQSDILFDAYNGKGSFENMPCKGIRAIAGLYTEECQIIVRADSDINSISDLYKKKISVGEKGSGTEKNASDILSVNGLTFDMADIKYMSFSETVKNLKDGNIDAFFCTSGIPLPLIENMSEKIDIRILSLDNQTIEKMIKKYKGYSKCVIPSETYRGQNEEITTVGVKSVLVANTDVSDEISEMLLKTVFSDKEELFENTDIKIPDIKFATSNIPVPFHKGVLKWYMENGAMVITDDDGETEMVLPTEFD